MTRPGDIGPYSVENVRIKRHEENVQEASLGHKLSSAGREKVAASKRGKPLNAKWRANISAAKMGNTGNLGYRHTLESQQKMRTAQRKRRAREQQLQVG